MSFGAVTRLYGSSFIIKKVFVPFAHLFKIQQSVLFVLVVCFSDIKFDLIQLLSKDIYLLIDIGRRVLFGVLLHPQLNEPTAN